MQNWNAIVDRGAFSFSLTGELKYLDRQAYSSNTDKKSELGDFSVISTNE